MDSLGSLGNFALLLLSVITLGTAAGVGFQRGKIAKLRGDVTEATERAERLEKALAESRAEAATFRTDLAALSRVVTGEAHWIAIGDQLSTHHAAATGHWEQQQDALERIARAVEGRKP